MGWMKDKFRAWLDIQPARQGGVSLVQPFTHEMSVFKNQLWYRGSAAELHQFFSQVDDGVNNTNFWSASASGGVRFRKLHSGLPALMVDTLADIVLRDLVGVTLTSAEAQRRWDAIAAENQLERVLKAALRGVMVEGDGAFKLCYDPAISTLPIVEFLAGACVSYQQTRGRLQAVVFTTRRPNPKNPKEIFLFEERYTRDGVSYCLRNNREEELPLSLLPELKGLGNVQNPEGFWMALPFMLEENPIWPGRGRGILEGKEGAFDAFDECISQWMDALRDGRSVKYIPESLVPRNPKDGSALRPNSFDNRYVQTGMDLAEGAKNQIEVKSGEIPHEALLATYTTLLDLCLQGVMSPSTLGIDVKKLDNAEAQREKEKATLYTRNRLVGALEEIVPRLACTALQMDDMLRGRVPGTYKANVSFGEYANPSFEAQVETVGKARQYGIMSVERALDELYGDSLSEEEKEEEAARLKAEQGAE